MKKVTLATLIIVICTITSYSQSGAKWATGGNSNSTGDFFGTTNNFPIDFKTNNVLRMNLGTNGVLKINSLAGTNTRLLQVDAGGNLIQLPQGASNQVLFGNGTWGNLPSSSNLWHANGTSMYYNNGYVGIGTGTPLFQLDVIGDARISNNLYVGGGIVITDKVRATGDVKTSRLEADTIKMDVGKVIMGETKIEGDVKARFKLEVTGESRFHDLTYFDQTVTASNNLNVIGQSYFNGNVQLQNGFTFDGVNGLRYTAPTATSAARYNLGGGIYQPQSTACPTPHQNFTWFATQGAYISHIGANTPGASPLVDASLSMMTAPWDGNGLIEVDGKDNNGGTSNGLLINYFCGRDVGICIGANKGRVTMGAEVDVQGGLKIGWNGAANIIDPNTSIEINQNTTNGNGIKVNTYNNGLNCFTVNNSNFTNSPFSIFADGSTVINAGNPTLKHFKITDASGTGTPKESFTILGNGRTDINAATKTDKYFVINDVSTVGSPVESFVVNGDGRTAIGDNYVPAGYHLAVKGKILATEVVVQLRTNWPDYVFNKEYKLKSLSEVEQYISKNKHLENIPSAKEIDANGVTLGNVVSKQMEKIEELTLYLIEQQKQIEELKKQMNTLKK